MSDAGYKYARWNTASKEMKNTPFILLLLVVCSLSSGSGSKVHSVLVVLQLLVVFQFVLRLLISQLLVVGGADSQYIKAHVGLQRAG